MAKKRQVKKKSEAETEPRRSALKRLAGILMGGGLVAAYGTLGVVMARYLFPARPAPRSDGHRPGHGQQTKRSARAGRHTFYSAPERRLAPGRG